MSRDFRCSPGHGLRLATAMALVLMPAAAFAQTATTQTPAADAPGAAAAPDAAVAPGAVDAPVGLEDIVVTARRSSENVQRVPIAITTVTAQKLNDLSIRDVIEVQKVTPGLFISSQNSAGRAKLTIRGQAEADSRLSTDGSVGIYIDGVPIARNYGLRSNLVDLAQIEVLKGPQGTLFGKNTTGGALNITTQHPTYDLGGYLDVLYGSYDNRQILGVANIPIKQDALAIRVVGQRIKRDGFGKNALGQGVGDDDVVFGRALVLVEPTSNLNILLSADYVKQKTNGANFLLTFDSMLASGNSATGSLGNIASQLGLNPALAADRLTAYNRWLTFFNQYGNQYGKKGLFYDNLGTIPLVDDVKHYGFSAVSTLDLGDVTAKSVTAYRRLSHFYDQDLDSTPFAIQESKVGTVDTGNFSQEFQLSSIDGTGLDWQAGLFYNREAGTEQSFSNSNAFVNTSRAAVVDVRVRNKSKAAYGQIVYNFSPTFRFTGGLRYTEDTRGITSHNRRDVAQAVAPALPTSRNACYVTVGGGSIDPAFCTKSVSTSFEKLTWLASVDWKPTDQVMLYASLSRGYRAGGYSIQAASTVYATQAALDAAFTPYLPEVIDNYEVGFKSDLLDRRLRVNGAFFYQNYKNIQAQIRDSVNGTVITLIRNAAKAKPYGGELEVTGQITPQWVVTTGVGYLHASYDSYFARDTAGNLLDLSNLDFPAPKWTANVGSTYTVPVSNGAIKLNLNLNYISRVNFRPGPAQNDASLSQPKYALLDGRISYHLDDLGLDIAVFGKNLTKKRYLNAATNLQSLGFNGGFSGDPRVFGLQVRKTF